jgi:hypothetical protein
MQDTANQNAAGFLPVKHNMLALLHAPQLRANFITRATERGIIDKELARIFELADIAVGLNCARKNRSPRRCDPTSPTELQV